MADINFGFWKKLARPIVGLAPMDGITDFPFREITVKYGAPDFTFTEFVAVEGLANSAVRLLDHFIYSERQRPVVAQIYGTDVAAFKVAAQLVAALGFDGLDINMGCPAKKATQRGAGAALINNPRLAEQIIKSCKEGVKLWKTNPEVIALPVKEKLRRIIAERRRVSRLPSDSQVLPVSVKTRIGYDRVVIKEWAQFLAGQKLAAISIHGRTLKQLYTGQADWEAIAEAGRIIKTGSQFSQGISVGSSVGRRSQSSLVLGNGDLADRAEATAKARQLGLDGALIGRAALGNPWALAAPSPRSVTTGITPRTRIKVAIEHARLFEKSLPPAAFPAFRRHLAAYVKGLPGAAKLRRELMQVKSAAEVAAMLISVS